MRSPTGASSFALRRWLDQAVAAENVGDARRRADRASDVAGSSGTKPSASCGSEQAMGVVEGRPEDLAARNILEGRGNPPPHLHLPGVDRLGRAETRQGGAEGADQEDRLDHVATRLLDRQRSELAIVQRAFAHHPIDGKAELAGDLRKREFSNIAIAAPLMREQAMGILDGAFASLDGDIHAVNSPWRQAAWCAGSRSWHRRRPARHRCRAETARH